jgi:hypothetical protein
MRESTFFPDETAIFDGGFPFLWGVACSFQVRQLYTIQSRIKGWKKGKNI